MQFKISPYMSFINNPIIHTDPDGGWIPGVDKDGNIILTAEKGDNRQTLLKFFNSKSQAEKFVPGWALAKGKMEVKWTAGDILELNESNYSKAIKEAKENPKKYEGDTYNCTDAAYAGSKGKDIVESYQTTGEHWGNSWKPLDQMPKRFQKMLDAEFKPAHIDELIFGQTIGTYRDDVGGDIIHSAVYFGKSNNGTIYVFTKNGFLNSTPQIMPLMDMKHSFEDYEKAILAGNTEKETGAYNPVDGAKPLKDEPKESTTQPQQTKK